MLLTGIQEPVRIKGDLLGIYSYVGHYASFGRDEPRSVVVKQMERAVELRTLLLDEDNYHRIDILAACARFRKRGYIMGVIAEVAAYKYFSSFCRNVRFATTEEDEKDKVDMVADGARIQVKGIRDHYWKTEIFYDSVSYHKKVNEFVLHKLERYQVRSQDVNDTILMLRLTSSVANLLYQKKPVPEEWENMLQHLDTCEPGIARRINLLVKNIVIFENLIKKFGKGDALLMVINTEELDWMTLKVS